MPDCILLDLPGALAKFGGAWRELAVGRGNAFVTPEWVEASVEALGADREVRVAVVTGDEGELLGVVPFEIRSQTARIAGADFADYLHPAAREPDELAVIEAAVAALAKEARWVTLVFDNADVDRPWYQAELAGRGGASLRRRERSQAVLPYAELPSTYEEYLAGRSGSFRRRLRQLDRRLEKAAAITMRQTRSQEELNRDMDTFFRLHYGRWEDRGGSSLGSARARAFHEGFAAAALAAGWLRLHLLEADGDPIAAFYGWRVGDRTAFYQAGFAPDWGNFSVGLILHGRVIAAAIEEAVREYDMLLGDEAYKFRFCDQTRRVATAVLTRRWTTANAAAATELAARRVAGRLPADLKLRMARLERRLPTARRR